jgi:hypothetical protein
MERDRLRAFLKDPLLKELGNCSAWAGNDGTGRQSLVWYMPTGIWSGVTCSLCLWVTGSIRHLDHRFLKSGDFLTSVSAGYCTLLKMWGCWMHRQRVAQKNWKWPRCKDHSRSLLSYCTLPYFSWFSFQCHHTGGCVW